MKKLDLNEAAEEFEMITSDMHLFYDKETGEFGFYGEYAETASPEEFEGDDWIAAPSIHDFREYDMMEEFADSVNVTPAREILFFSLEGKGAFRRFKDALLRVGLRDEWFAFKRRAYIKIAREWCIKNGIEYIDVVETDKPKNVKAIKPKQAVKPCKNVPKCVCPKSECPNHGKCCSCVIKHREGGNLPFCLRGESNAV
jgi:hypothetical protein